MTVNPSRLAAVRTGERAGGDAQTFTGNRALQIEEPLIFEMGQTETLRRRSAASRRRSTDRLGGLRRSGEIGLPGLSEPQVVRHYTRLSPEELRHRPGRLPARARAR